MRNQGRPIPLLLFLVAAILFAGGAVAQIGSEKAIPDHLADGQEFVIPLKDLLAHGQKLFQAVWTSQEGGGRPLTKGTGAPVSDPSSPLVFPRNTNRVSAPDANSCFGCHAQPRVGGGGDMVANVFVLGQRFDFATFDTKDNVITRGSRDESGKDTTLQTIADERLTLSMFGSGFIELLAREMTAGLQAIRNAIPAGGCSALVTKEVSFGTLCRDGAGNWNTAAVTGLGAASLGTTGPSDPPNLIIRPFHQAGRVISLREFTNNAFNHHHGIQPTERFGVGTDPDGDGFTDELTRADVTAATVFQAALAVPGQLIPKDQAFREAIALGQQKFAAIGCTGCHISSLPVNNPVFTEPNPFNPAGNLQPGSGVPTFSVDLTSDELPSPRLKRDSNGIVHVPAFTDLKLHDITSGPGDPNREPLDQHQTPGTAAFFAGNGKIITRKLWGAGNEPPFFHHGKFTTIRESILNHFGEANATRLAFQALPDAEKDAVIEFLKSLQILPEGTKFLKVDEKGNLVP